MSYIQNTPEALLPRSDSKNPATTCKGITSSGRPCRRSLAASPRASPSNSPNPKRGNQGVLAVLPDVNDSHEGAAAFYCWQHKEQAPTASTPGKGRTALLPLQERTSIDTLADRLGVLEVEDGTNKKKKRQPEQGRPLRKDTLPQQWQNVPGPFLAVPQDSFGAQIPSNAHRKRTKGDIHFSFFCCMSKSDSDDLLPVKPRPAVAQVHTSSNQTSSKPPSSVSPRLHIVNPPQQSHTSHRLSSQHPAPNVHDSHNLSSLSFIPHSLDSAKQSILLSELAKPLTSSDREYGYIYIFCLSSMTTQSTPPQAYTPSIPQRTLTGRRTSDAIQSFGQDVLDGSGGLTTGRSRHRNSGSRPVKRKLMLKIGRAQNVSRRMTQWAQQCGHPIDLLRYYPYYDPNKPSLLVSPHPSPHRSPGDKRRTSSTSVQALGPKKVPAVARVERMIHLELAEQRVKRDCEGCGREHREWFEVEATKDAVRAVDDVVKRWVRWGEWQDDGA